MSNVGVLEQHTVPSRPIMRTPRQIDIDITSRCNLRCSYCYFFDDSARTYADLPTSDWIQFFESCGQFGIMRLTLAGGEPFMREDLAELIDAIVRNRMRFSILSNGTLVDDTVARMLAASGRCDSVQISIDGSCSKVHDTCRGDGAFDGAVRGIQLLQSHGVPVTSRITIRHGNVDDLENTARLLLDTLAIPQIGTNSAGGMGTCAKTPETLQLSPEEYGRAMKTLAGLVRTYGERITAQAGPLASLRMWNRMERARFEHAPPFSSCGTLSACGCVWERMAVLADGTITPCPLLPHLTMGNITSDDIGALWRDSPVIRRMRERSAIPLSSFAFCKDCEYSPYCTGNCPALARAQAGTHEHPSPDGCLREYVRAGGVLARENE